MDVGFLGHGSGQTDKPQRLACSATRGRTVPFSRVLLDAVNDPAADTDHVGLINATALAHYVARDVSSLTDGKQNPDMEVRFDTTVFAVGL
jgi:hypothetical protein